MVNWHITKFLGSDNFCIFISSGRFIVFVSTVKYGLFERLRYRAYPRNGPQSFVKLSFLWSFRVFCV